jgi:fatty acid desaturase/ferredoxin
MTPTATASARPDSGGRQPLPDPGVGVPLLALPTVAVFGGVLATFAVSTVLAIDHDVPRAVTIAVDAVVSFVMFTVSHDASHFSISRIRWVNSLLGRLSFVFVTPALSFRSFGYLHIEHHRHANDDDNDPDTFASHGSGWRLPFRLAVMDVAYVPFYLRRIRSRPKLEVAESACLATLTVVGVVVAAATGTLWPVAVIYIIPERIAVVFLAWWFDWLPHHGLEDTQRDNRYRATRNRVGMEWLFTPLMLSQNYHLVHHLHPSIPFYRYLSMWRRNADAYLERQAAIVTVFGSQPGPEEYREWKRLNRKLLRLVPESRFTLVYANRTRKSTMFRHELAGLESRYSDRQEIIHVLSQEPLHTPDHQGRIDGAKLGRWLAGPLRPDTVSEWFLCGPRALTTLVRDALIAAGVDPDRVHLELFFGYEPGGAGGAANAGSGATVSFRLSGREHTFDLLPGQSLLDGALQRRPDAPYACMGGACGTCRAKLMAGQVEMDQNFALGTAELEQGYILTCQSHPTTPAITIDYDA